ncbi:MAG: MucBP domain-containing protein, partial [Micrococcales bacterium]|nr:MucBP domain-containing protein [Micrococcales bacterium]
MNGVMYYADPYWNSAPMMNGMIVSYNNNTWDTNDGTGAGNGTQATARATVRQLAYALGVVNGTPDPTTNEAVTAYTQSTGTAPAGGMIMAQTTSEITFGSEMHGRFVTFAITAAATNCWDAAHPTRGDPQYQLSLLSGSVETVVSSTPINVCALGSSAIVTVPALANGTANPVKAGRFVGDNAVLLDTTTSFAVIVRNLTSEHLGNDGAWDDLQIVDVTPQLDKSFSVSTANTGDVIRLTFTVTNTSELGIKDGWAFTDTLPSGMVVAANPGTVVNGMATVSAPPGSNTITVTNGVLDDGDTSATISLNVTTTRAGTFSNGAANISADAGLNFPATATVTVTDPVPPQGSVAARYVDTNGNFLAATVLQTGTVGSSWTTSAKTIDGYQLVAVQDTSGHTTAQNGTYAADQAIVVYVYQPVVQGSVAARYVDTNGNFLAATVLQTGNVGTSWTTSPKTIDGYQLVAVQDTSGNTAAQAGTYTDDQTVVVYVYQPVAPQGSVAARYVDTSGNFLAATVLQTGNVGTSWTTSAKTISGYQLVAVQDTSGNTTAQAGTYTDDQTIVVYVYQPVAPQGSVVARYVDT